MAYFEKKNDSEEILLEGLKFLESLGSNLKEDTLKGYYTDFRNYARTYGLTMPSQEQVNEFIFSHDNFRYRSMLKNYLYYKKWRDLEIPKRRGRTSRKIKRLPNEDEIHEIMDYLWKHSASSSVPLAYEIILECGLRIGEVLRIQKEDIDFNTWINDMKVNRNSSCEVLIKGKGDKDRMVVIRKPLMIIIYNYCKNLNPSDYLIVNKLGKIFRREELSTFFNVACKKLGHSKMEGDMNKSLFHPHLIRKYRATRWYKEGADIVEIKNRLGHASISTTQIYIEPDEKDLINKWKIETS